MAGGPAGWQVGPAGDRSAQSSVAAEVAKRSKVIEAVYPVDGSAIVKILGGADPVRDVLGYLPESWQVIPFGSNGSSEFLAQLDFFVYYHHPAWVEASGAKSWRRWLAVSRRSCRRTFVRCSATRRSTPSRPEVPSLVGQLYGDRAAYEDIVARAESFGSSAVRTRRIKVGSSEPIGPPET